jgi:hypothetical protein
LFSNGNLIEVPDAKTFVSLDRPDVVMNAIAEITARKPGTARQHRPSAAMPSRSRDRLPLRA